MKKIHEVVIKEPEFEVNGQPLLLQVELMYQFFKERNDLTLYNYFESMCKLVSLMCLQRNYKGIQVLEKIYTLDFSIDCFLNENVPKLLRANLAKILITLHIDKDPLEILNIPILTRVWQEIPFNKMTIPKSRVPVSIKLLKIKDFFLEFITSLNGT